MIDVHKPGISAYGVVQGDPVTRVDGHCLLVDSNLFRNYMLDESHQWFWSVTKLQAQVLNAGYSVQGFVHHDDLLYHFGGKSGRDFKRAKGMDVIPDEVIGWFKGLSISTFDTIIDHEQRQIEKPNADSQSNISRRTEIQIEQHSQ